MQTSNWFHLNWFPTPESRMKPLSPEATSRRNQEIVTGGRGKGSTSSHRLNPQRLWPRGSWRGLLSTTPHQRAPFLSLSPSHHLSKKWGKWYNEVRESPPWKRKRRLFIKTYFLLPYGEPGTVPGPGDRHWTTTARLVTLNKHWIPLSFCFLIYEMGPGNQKD